MVPSSLILLTLPWIPAIVTILEPFCICSWNCLANLAFLAWGRIIKSQNTRIIPPSRISCIVPAPPPLGAACKKTNNSKCVIVLYSLNCVYKDASYLRRFFVYLHDKLQGIVLYAFGIGVHE